jgi:photosystem II stability/assembly factor-like uncharacterized protein
MRMVKPRRLLMCTVSAPVLRAGALTVVLAAAWLATAAAAPPAGAAGADWRAPFLLEPGIGLFEQYGYAPAYTRHVPAFDSADRAYIRSRTAGGESTSYVHTPADGRWTRLDFRSALLAAYPDFAGTAGAGGLRSDGIVFDRQDRAYNPLTIRLTGGQMRNVLMVSWDRCRSWKVFTLPDGDFTVEHWVGHNQIDGPPFLAYWLPSPLPYAGHRGGRYTLWVTQPRLEDKELIIPTPAHVTDAFLGLGRDAGGASIAVTHGDSTWVVWAGTAEIGVRGVPQYIARYDHLTSTVGTPRRLMSTPPANDPHNTPGICIDSQGYLHVVGGTHGTAVPYVRSLVPYSSDGGWTLPTPVLADGYASATDPPQFSGRQTYDSFVCDSQDTLHLITRQWRRGPDEPFPGKYYGALVHQSQPAGGTWGAPTVVVVPSAPGYAIYYHKLALDHRDRLFLSCSYRGGADLWADRARGAALRVLGRALPWRTRYRRRMLLVSEDGGSTWRFAADADLAGGSALDTARRRTAPRDAGGTDPPPPGFGWLSPTPQGNQFTAIDFAGASLGWAAGTNGTLNKTVDGGVTWMSQGPQTDADLFGLVAADRRTAWAVGEDGLILNTADGGRTWNPQPSGTTQTLFAVAAVSARRAWVVGAHGLILATGDGGRSWRRQRAGMAEDLFSADFTDALHGWAAGGYGYVLRTLDGGRTWRPQATGTSAALYGVSFYDRWHGLAVGGGGIVLRTADGGQTWWKGRSRVTTQLNAARMASARRAWVTGAGGVTLASADGGRTWRVHHLPVNGMAGAVEIGPDGSLWTGGAAGTVCHSLDGGRTWARLSAGLTSSINAVVMHRSQLWVAGEGGLLARREGDAWSRVALGTTVELKGLAFNGADAWVVGAGAFVARSADGGETWTRLAAPSSTDLTGVAALGEGRAWMAGRLGALLSTADGGASWRLSAITPDDLHCVAFLDPAHGWAGGGSPYGEGRAVVLRSGDGGLTWERVETPAQGRVLALTFIDAEHGWAVAEDWGVDGDEAQGAILATADGGRSWVLQATSPAVLTSVAMDAAGIGWAFGADGAALATRAGGATWQALTSGTDYTLRACEVPALGALSASGPAGWVVGDGGAVLELAAGAP